MTDMERDLRDMMQRTANGVHHVPRPSRGLVNRARIRRVRTAAFAGAAALALVIGGFAGARSLTSDEALPPAEEDSNVSPFVDTWTSTDVDERTRTMVIRASGEDAYEITVQNHLALVCSGAPSTLTGTGQLNGTTRLVIPSPEITCDDGSEPKAGGFLLEEIFRNLTFEHDPESEIITNYSPLESRRSRPNAGDIYSGHTLVWGRADAENRIGDVGGWIAYGDTRGIWARDLTSPGDPADRVLLSSAPGTPIAWSPDGSKLLVLREVRASDPGGLNEADLFVLNADGTATRLTDANAWPTGGSFSPDGSQIVYATGDEDPHRSFVWVIDASGGDPRPVHRTDDHLDHPTFSPDGSLIAYFEGGGDHSNTLQVMNADGSGSRTLIEREFGHVRGLQWSPDGSRLVFASDGIWIVGADGTGLMRVSSDESDQVGLDRVNPHWFPDGSHIAYTRDEDKSGSLEIIRLEDLRVQNFGDGESGPWTAELRW